MGRTEIESTRLLHLIHFNRIVSKLMQRVFSVGQVYLLPSSSSFWLPLWLQWHACVSSVGQADRLDLVRTDLWVFLTTQPALH